MSFIAGTTRCLSIASTRASVPRLPSRQSQAWSRPLSSHSHLQLLSPATNDKTAARDAKPSAVGFIIFEGHQHTAVVNNGSLDVVDSARTVIVAGSAGNRRDGELQ